MKYGDYDNVGKDAKTLYEIHDRQGSTLLLEVIAERVGQACLKFSLTGIERKRVHDSLVNELSDLINERI